MTLKKGLWERDGDDARWAEYQRTGDAVANSDVVDWLRRIGTSDEGPRPR